MKFRWHAARIMVWLSLIHISPGESALSWVPVEAKKSHIKVEADIYMKGDGAVVAVPAGAYGGLTHYYAPRLLVLEKLN